MTQGFSFQLMSLGSWWLIASRFLHGDNVWEYLPGEGYLTPSTIFQWNSCKMQILYTTYMKYKSLHFSSTFSNDQIMFYIGRKTQIIIIVCCIYKKKKIWNRPVGVCVWGAGVLVFSQLEEDFPCLLCWNGISDSQIILKKKRVAVDFSLNAFKVKSPDVV